MIKHHIRPQDISDQDAAKVLDFLNQAGNCGQIAEAIRIPGEPDVGRHSARRIIEARKALGGRFRSLKEVAAVKYIGPERFTNIVMVLTGMYKPPSTGEKNVTARLTHEIAVLRETVAAIQARAGQACRLSLGMDRKNAFIGQPVTLTAQVKNQATGHPVPNARLTLATNWGTLDARVGFTNKQGRVVTTVTDFNGMVQAVFSPPATEKLSAGQKAALATALLDLDRDAHTPVDILSPLKQMVHAYHQAQNRDLRIAVDVYFKQMRGQIEDAAPPESQLESWEYENALVTAYTHENPENSTESSSVQCMAAVNLELKNWLPPFYSVFTKTKALAAVQNQKNA